MISVITPSYNQGKFIERTIKSVLSQSIPNLEYVVVDGGSTDETLDILKRYATQLRYVSEKDRGQTDAVNKGLAMTSGDIIGWLNSDDIYYPDALKTINTFFAEHPDVDVVYGQANYIDQDDAFLSMYETEEWNLERLKDICYLAQPSVFFRRRVVEQFGLLDEKLIYCMDYEYWLRLALHGAKFAFLPKVFSAYRLYDGTKTVSAAAKAQYESILMLRKQLGFVPDSWLIYYAVTTVQNKTRLKMPQWRYLAALYAVGVCSAFRWNGFLKGIQTLFALPKAMLALRRSRQAALLDKKLFRKD